MTLKNLTTGLATGLIAALISSEASAFGAVLDQWRLFYPNSDAGNFECQLCHQDTSGGDPWNAYGWDLNQRITNPFDADQVILAFRQIEDEDSDGNGISNLDEINDHFQPGWRDGNTNQTFSNVGNGQSNLTPPDATAVTGIDHPDAVDNPFADIETGNISVEFVEVAEDLARPVKAVAAPGINGSIFIVEQAGQIFRVDLTTFERTLFLDVRPRVLLSENFSDERGMLGLAFHPQFASNGLFYTFQSEAATDHPQTDFPSTAKNHVSAVVEYQVSDPSCNSFVSRTQTLLTVDQPQGNHNAGDIAFGPDGMLYIALGDGGGASDEGAGHGPFGNGRDNTNPLGAILRIDVDGSNSSNGLYGIPNDNPFVSDNGLDEIFAYGFRNPYRFTFDANTGELYTGDVGQDDIEEINIVTSGANYGWNWKEGSFFFYDTNDPNQRYVSDVAPPGLPNDLIDPVAEYDHDDGVSVIGGYVYRGSQIPVLSGRYVFGEFLSRLLFLTSDDEINEIPTLNQLQTVRGFGQDSDNELYVLDNDRLFKIQAPGTSYSPPQSGEETAQCPPSEDQSLCFPIISANGATAVVCL